MNIEIINDYFSKYEQKITAQSIKDLVVFNCWLSGLAFIMLFFVKAYICMAVSLALLVIVSVLCRKIAKKHLKRPHNAAAYSLLFSYMIFLFNLFLYFIQKVTHTFEIIFFLLIIAFEFLCLGSGLFCTYRSVKKAKVINKNATAVPLMLVGSLGYSIGRIVEISARGKTVEVDALIYTVAFIACLAVLSFVLGTSYFAMLYFFKKYDMK